MEPQSDNPVPIPSKELDYTTLPTLTFVESPPVLTETILSSFSSDRSTSSALGNGSSTGSALLSTGFSTFSTSTSASRRSSMQFSRHVEVKETLDASLTENAVGDKQLKQYVLKRIIGQGAFGKVHLAEDENTKICYAVKEFSKSKLRKKDKANLFKLGPRGRGRGRRGPEAPSPLTSESSPLDLIRGEVAILKKLNHINIVKLYEVLDVATDDSMYMVFEYCERGALMPVSLTETYENVFSDDECRDVFQQMVLGIEYLHEHDIIHRDIKPDNLLRSQDGTLKIVDFGVSEMFDKKGDDLTKKSAGSPAFMAPELCRPDHGEVSGRATDVWSMGVTLYCIRYGHLPFVSSNIIDMNRYIRENDFETPGEQDPRFMNLMRQLLEKDPTKRIGIEDLRNDPWLTNDGREPLISKDENIKNAVTEVTEEDLRGAIQKINGLVTVFKAIARFKRGIKTPSTKSTSSSPRESKDGKDLSLASISLADKMQDADESTHVTSSNTAAADSASKEVITVEVGIKVKDPSIEATPSIMTAAEEIVAKELDTALKDVLEKEDKHKEHQKTKIKVTSKLEEPAKEAAQKENQDDSIHAEEEPRGYEVCDMLTGECRWVPFDKADIALDLPEDAAVQAFDSIVEQAKGNEEKDEREVNSSQAGLPQRDLAVKVSKVSTVEVKVHDVAEAVASETSVAPLVSDSSSKLTLTQTSSESSNAGTLAESSKSGTSSPETILHNQNQSQSRSGSSSPSSRSLAPGNGGTRLVGKLSRDRLAIFERS
ncbi:hypothetical protein BG004_001139 [Podila humilis]|nr:hypothetical protein BG004_001139 [Podila humilis]